MIKNVSKEEIITLKYWLNANKENTSPEVLGIIENLLNFSVGFADASMNREAMLRLMKTLMKLTPSSEKGSSGPKI